MDYAQSRDASIKPSCRVCLQTPPHTVNTKLSPDENATTLLRVFVGVADVLSPQRGDYRHGQQLSLSDYASLLLFIWRSVWRVVCESTYNKVLSHPTCCLRSGEVIDMATEVIELLRATPLA